MLFLLNHRKVKYLCIDLVWNACAVVPTTPAAPTNQHWWATSSTYNWHSHLLLHTKTGNNFITSSRQRIAGMRLLSTFGCLGSSDADLCSTIANENQNWRLCNSVHLQYYFIYLRTKSRARLTCRPNLGCYAPPNQPAPTDYRKVLQLFCCCF